MSNDWKEDFKFHWSLATCTLEGDERVIANEKLEAILQSDMFNQSHIFETNGKGDRKWKKSKL